MLILLLACNGDKTDDGTISDLSAVVSPDIVTIVTATWSTTDSTRAMVRYSFDGADYEAPRGAPATSHSATLRGIPSDTDVEIWIELEDGTTSESVSVTTGTLPTEMPTMTVEGSGQSGFLLTPLLGGTVGPIVVDGLGNIVWYHVDDSGLDVYRARMQGSGDGIIYNAASVSGDPADDSRLIKVSWDGSTVEEVPVPLLAHDFVELDDGSIIAIVVEYGKDDAGAEVRGDSLVEILPDGTQTPIWSAWDCFDPDVEIGDDPELGWTFANALDYDPDEDAFLLSLRNFSSIIQIDRASGSCDWGLGGEAGTLDIDGDSFLHEHQFDRTPTGIVVFDNSGAGSNASRAIEYTLDLDAGTATEVWSYKPVPSVYSFVLGDAHRYDDGDTLVTFSVAGEVNRVTADGDAEWVMNTELGAALGFVDPQDDLYLED
jgi:Arylsulfotransferase (ASST)